MAVARRDLRLLPKAHLHLHLEGAMRRTTLDELARRDGKRLGARFENVMARSQARGDVWWR